MTPLPRVDVLLATFNGAAFLPAQLDSVLGQENVDVRILVRDDGSRDGTPDIVRAYMARHPGKLILVEDDAARLGASGNFLRLLARPSDAEFFAFCDQDDVWAPDKLAVAVACLQKLRQPCRLYFSAVEYVDESLGHIGCSRRDMRPAFANALVENIAPGCTMVMDAALRELVAAHRPESATIHDWWLYLVATALGQVVFDPVPRIKYRQHGANTVGAGLSPYQLWRRRLQRFLAGRAWRLAAQASEFGRLYADSLAPEQWKLIEHLVAGKSSVRARFRFLFSGNVWRQSHVDTLFIKLQVLLNAY